jgi:rubrerythrin
VLNRLFEDHEMKQDVEEARRLDSARPASRAVPAPGTAKPKAANPIARQIISLGVLHAHALAIEHEAEARYRELATRMADCGNDSVAALFSRLADFEAEHAFHWAKKSFGVEIPVLAPGEYAWLDAGAPLPEAHAFVYRMMTPRLALEIALRAEERAKGFFERVRGESPDPAVRDLAAEFARDEDDHIAWVRDALQGVPLPYRPTEDQPRDPAIAQEL